MRRALPALTVAVATALGGCSTADSGPQTHDQDEGPVVVEAAGAQSKAEDAHESAQGAQGDPSHESGTYVLDCLGPDPLQTPETLNLDCESTNAYLDDLAWESWGGSQARAEGELVVNDCEPTCAEGEVERFSVRATADQVEERDDSSIYTRMTVRWQGARPEDAISIQRYPLPQ